MTAAGKFADEAEALGWTVERIRTFEGEGRQVNAARADEKFVLTWRRNLRGNMVYSGGYYSHPSTGKGRVDVTNVKAALREMAQHPAIEGDGRLPFDADADDDKTVLAAVAGRTVYWRNSISGLEQHDECPRGGKHLTLSPYVNGTIGTNEPRNRALNFPGPHGFHSVRLAAITKVK